MAQASSIRERTSMTLPPTSEIRFYFAQRLANYRAP
jgi:hypothetical protein